MEILVYREAEAFLLFKTHTALTGQSLKEMASAFFHLHFAYRYFHVAKLADGTKAASFLPETAGGLAAHSGLAVSERTAVSLHRQTVSSDSSFWSPTLSSPMCACSRLVYFAAGRIVKEVAVVSMAGHSKAVVKERPLNPAAASLMGRQEPP